jgi:hypothetical protein
MTRRAMVIGFVLAGAVGCQEPLAKYNSEYALTHPSGSRLDLGAAEQTDTPPMAQVAHSPPATPSSPGIGTPTPSQVSAGFSDSSLSEYDPDYEWFEQHYRRDVKRKLQRPLTASFRRRLFFVHRSIDEGVKTLEGMGGGSYLDELGESVEFGFVVTYRQAPGGGWELKEASVQQTP